MRLNLRLRRQLPRNNVQHLRVESLRALQEAAVCASAQVAEEARLEPLSICWCDSPRWELGALSWPLPSVLRHQAATFVPLLERAWAIQACPWLEWRGVVNGFANFAWSALAYAEIIRRATSPEPPAYIWENPVHLQRWTIAKLTKLHGDANLTMGDILAYQRTLQLVKMGRDLLKCKGHACHQRHDKAGDHWGSLPQSGPGDRLAISVSEGQKENGVLQEPPVSGMQELLARVERLKWAQITHPKLIASQRAQLARLWNRYYEKCRLLKGTARQIEARLWLAQAVRFGLEMQ